MITKIMQAKQSLPIYQFGVLAKEYYLQAALLKLLKKQNKLLLDAVSLDCMIGDLSNQWAVLCLKTLLVKRIL